MADPSCVAFASSGAESFADVWSRKVWPAIKSDYEELVKQLPTRWQEQQHQIKAEKKKPKVNEGFHDIVTRKLQKLIAETVEKKERRNIYLNLAWTGPIDNTRLQAHIPFEKVYNMALDMFIDVSQVASKAEPASDVEAAARAAVHGEEQEHDKFSRPKESLQEVLKKDPSKRKWKIPAAVERGFEIPICISSAGTVPELGNFKRLHMDVVVNAAWLALFWAKEDRNDAAASAVKKLMLDWPMDFVLIEGSTPEDVEENKFKWAVNMSAKVERLRDFVGTENNNLMRIVAAAADIVTGKLVSGKKASPEAVRNWMADNIRWGVFSCPDVLTVQRHMNNWAAIARSGTALQLIESAVQRWGRSNLLEIDSFLFPTSGGGFPLSPPPRSHLFTALRSASQAALRSAYQEQMN